MSLFLFRLFAFNVHYHLGIYFRVEVLESNHDTLDLIKPILKLPDSSVPPLNGLHVLLVHGLVPLLINRRHLNLLGYLNAHLSLQYDVELVTYVPIVENERPRVEVLQL